VHKLPSIIETIAGLLFSQRCRENLRPQLQSLRPGLEPVNPESIINIRSMLFIYNGLMGDITRNAYKAYFDRIIWNSVYDLINTIEKQQFTSGKTASIIVCIGAGRPVRCFM
jgi:hypothetical protein